MNSIKSAFLLTALVLGFTAAAEADANGRHFRGHGHHRSSVGVWFTVPGPFWYPPPYYYPRYYYPPAVVVPAPVAPPVYVERPPLGESAAPAESSAAYWYYCRDTQTYYPYVQQCASPWERVVPNSAPPS